MAEGLSGVATPKSRARSAGPRGAQAAASVSGSNDSPTAADTATAANTRRGRSDRSASGRSDEPEAKPRRGLGGWLRRAKDDDEADEYRKVHASNESADNSADKASRPPTGDRRGQRAEAKATRLAQSAKAKEERLAQRAQAKEDRLAAKRSTARHDDKDATHPGTPRRWLAKVPKPKLPKLPKLARQKLPETSEPKQGGWLSGLKFPSIGLSALRLKPPEEGEDRRTAAVPAEKLRPVNEARPLPGTKSSHVDNFDDDDDEDGHDGRPLSKAERKRLRRNQQQGRRVA